MNIFRRILPILWFALILPSMKFDFNWVICHHFKYYYCLQWWCSLLGCRQHHNRVVSYTRQGSYFSQYLDHLLQTFKDTLYVTTAVSGTLQQFGVFPRFAPLRSLIVGLVPVGFLVAPGVSGSPDTAFVCSTVQNDIAEVCQ